MTVALVLALQLVGWNVASPERAVLVRIVTVGAGIFLLGAMGAYLATRHGRVKEIGQRVRVRAARPPVPLGWVIALLLLLAAGALYVLTNTTP